MGSSTVAINKMMKQSELACIVAFALKSRTKLKQPKRQRKKDLTNESIVLNAYFRRKTKFPAIKLFPVPLFLMLCNYYILNSKYSDNLNPMLNSGGDYQPGFAGGYTDRHHFLGHRTGVISFTNSSIYCTITDIIAGGASWWCTYMVYAGANKQTKKNILL